MNINSKEQPTDSIAKQHLTQLEDNNEVQSDNCQIHDSSSINT